MSRKYTALDSDFQHKHSIMLSVLTDQDDYTEQPQIKLLNQIGKKVFDSATKFGEKLINEVLTGK